MKIFKRWTRLRGASAPVVRLANCASNGVGRILAQPVLYPNTALKRAVDAQGRQQADACIAQAQASRQSPMQLTQQVARCARQGAATVGVASAIGALITGQRSEGMQRCLSEKGVDLISWN